MPSPVEFVSSIARSLVNHPDEVKARWVDKPEGGGYVELNVLQQDRGQIIGKQGRNIQSIRRLATAAFAKEGEEVGVELLD
ncbi:MAG: KH domain-containing protein [Elusimicrobia bacterium]|nr:KH domain-containing protein [Elusimicrobiota bacterium]